jgi:hypothetical protein
MIFVSTAYQINNAKKLSISHETNRFFHPANRKIDPIYSRSAAKGNSLTICALNLIL